MKTIIRKAHEARQEMRKSAKLSQRTTDRLLFGDGSDSDDEPIEVKPANKNTDRKSSEKPANQRQPTRTNEKEDRTSAVFNRVMTYGQLNAEKKVEKQKSKPRKRFIIRS